MRHRRELLRLGALSALGLTLSDFFRLTEASAAGTPQRDVSCILIWLDGGPSHLDTFDPKPDAPSEIRGDFRAIPTAIDGVRICEHLPRTAQALRHVALVRSLTHELGNHDTGSHLLLTGHRPNPSLRYPSIGSVVAQVARPDALPPYLAVPEAVDSLRAGFLPPDCDPFVVGGGAGARDLAPDEHLGLERVGRRRDALAQLDRFARAAETGEAGARRDAAYARALRLMTSAPARRALQLDDEPAGSRARYGPSRVGQGCLMARRLVEAGARFVTVVDRGWDTHRDIGRELPDARFPGSGKLPSLDRAYATLLEDLHDRGLLETTLVVLMGEFGRTPKINAAGGRDHWPQAGFACLAGAGIRGGQAIGATDAHGELPAERPVTPEDLCATVYARLGIDTATELRTPDGRPIRLAPGGVALPELR